MKTYSLWRGYNFSLIQKIALSGLFIALACVFNKIFAINYISAVPFVRVSFGGIAVIIFASYLLGPLYGLLIGGLQDIVGYFVFDIKAYPWYPTITMTYVLLGFLTPIIIYFIKKIKNVNWCRIICYATLSMVLILTSLYIIICDKAIIFDNVYTIDLWIKIAFPILSFCLLAILIAVCEIIYHKQKKDLSNIEINIFQLMFSCFLIDLFIITLYGSLMKAIAFGMDLFLIILFCQALTMFFNVPFNVIVLNILLRVTKRYYRVIN